MVDIPIEVSQQPLFDIEPITLTIEELFPAVWGATEALTHHDAEVRIKALHYLRDSKAAGISPLVAFMVATRLADPDVRVRTGSVWILADIMRGSQQERAPEAVRKCITRYLTEMRTRQIYDLLIVAQQQPESVSKTAVLLNSSAYAGAHLVDIAFSKKAPLEIRKIAIRLIGLVGFIDAQPSLERLLDRLETRMNGQRAMPFAPIQASDENELVPEIRMTLASLRIL